VSSTIEAEYARSLQLRDFRSFEQQLKKRLVVLESAQSKNDLRLLPGNHFEQLIGDRL